jgi:hypothetical protein
MTGIRHPSLLAVAVLCIAGLLPGLAVPASAVTAPLDVRGAAIATAPDTRPAAAPPSVSADLWRAYRQAIIDSTTATPAEVVTDLLVPTPADPRTEWKTVDGVDYVLVGLLRRDLSMFTGINPGDAFTVKGDRWVAIPKELQQACTQYRCRRIDDAALDLQLKMINGLPPDADYGYIAHFWVKPADMFRPCTDPRLASATCPEEVVLDASRAPVLPMVGATDTTASMWIQANFAWRLPDHFRPKVAVSCAKNWQTQDCYGFPWTRLGYTYDWSPTAKDERGVTEFIVVNGATAYLESTGVQRDFFPRFAS